MAGPSGAQWPRPPTGANRKEDSNQLAESPTVAAGNSEAVVVNQGRVKVSVVRLLARTFRLLVFMVLRYITEHDKDTFGFCFFIDMHKMSSKQKFSGVHSSQGNASVSRADSSEESEDSSSSDSSSSS